MVKGGEKELYTSVVYATLPSVDGYSWYLNGDSNALSGDGLKITRNADPTVDNVYVRRAN